MTREEAIKLHKEKIWRNSIGDDKWKIEDLVNVIFDEHEAELKAKNDRIETQKQAISFLESRIGNRSCENCNPTRMGVENRDCQNCFWHPDSGLYDHFIPR